jgi:hypothetical protein
VPLLDPALVPEAPVMPTQADVQPQDGGQGDGQPADGNADPLAKRMNGDGAVRQ